MGLEGGGVPIWGSRGDHRGSTGGIKYGALYSYAVIQYTCTAQYSVQYSTV